MPLTNANLLPFEVIPDNIKITGPCHGTEKTGTDFMITASVRDDPRHDGTVFHDLFLTRAQVEALHAQIGVALAVVEKRPTTSP